MRLSSSPLPSVRNHPVRTGPQVRPYRSLFSRASNRRFSLGAKTFEDVRSVHMLGEKVRYISYFSLQNYWRRAISVKEGKGVQGPFSHFRKPHLKLYAPTDACYCQKVFRMGFAQCDEINCKNYRSGECSLTVGRPIELIDGLNCKFQKKVHLSTRVSNVRDYKDRFILRMLQDEARRENPGFRLFDSGSQRAKVFWIGAGYNQRPVGYLCTRFQRPF